MGFTAETKAVAVARLALHDARNTGVAFNRAVAERVVAEWEGCGRCRGRGWVVIWDTMDSMSGCYAEFGDCPDPDCTPETRAASGLRPGGDKYDRNRGVKVIEPKDLKTPGEEEAYAVILAEVRAAEAALVAAEDAAYVGKGTEVVVFKGRKVPIGTEARVFWIGDGRYGTRVGMTDAAGETHWSAAGNVVPAGTEPAKPPRKKKVKPTPKEVGPTFEELVG